MYYLGVDGGGTKTAAILVNISGSKIQRAKCGSGNITTLNRRELSELISELLTAVLDGIPAGQISGATLAFAGLGRDHEKQRLSEVLQEQGLRHYQLVTDAEMHYYSFFGDDLGILLAAGTGSICLVKDSNKRFHKIGGWGHLLSDEGSGFDLGRKAIRQAVEDAENGLRQSHLTDELLKLYQLEKPQQLISMIYAELHPVKIIAGAAQIIGDLAAQGDDVAIGLIDDAVDNLIQLLSRAIVHLSDEKQICIGLAGGLLRSESLMQKKFKNAARQRWSNLEFKSPAMTLAAAGCLHAIQSGGDKPSEALVRQLTTLDG